MTAPMPWLPDPSACACCGTALVADAVRSPDRFFQKSPVYSYRSCPQCHTLFLDAPGWSFADAYAGDYPAFATPPSVAWYHRILPSYFFPAVPDAAPDPVVEIGCGTGLMLKYLQEKGRSVKGYEPDAGAVAVAKAVDAPVEQGTWEDFAADDESVGVLVMNQVIEHLVQPPAEVFERVVRMLKPGGVWVLRTPNAGSWGRFQYGPFWHPLETPRHTVIYSLAGLSALATASGLRVAGRRCCGRWYDLGQSAFYRKRDGQGTVLDRLFSLDLGLRPFARLAAMGANLAGRGDSMEFILEKPR